MDFFLHRVRHHASSTITAPLHANTFTRDDQMAKKYIHAVIEISYYKFLRKYKIHRKSTKHEQHFSSRLNS